MGDPKQTPDGRLSARRRGTWLAQVAFDALIAEPTILQALGPLPAHVLRDAKARMATAFEQLYLPGRSDEPKPAAPARQAPGPCPECGNRGQSTVDGCPRCGLIA